MSQPIIPFDVWPQQIVQASVPANSNSLRNMMLASKALSLTVSEQPASPAEGDMYILPANPTGSAWSNFEVDDLALFAWGSWFAFAPVPGVRVPVGDLLYIFDGSSGWQSFSETGVTWGSIAGDIADQTDLNEALSGKISSVQAGDNITIDNTDPENPVISSTGSGGGAYWGEITGTLSDQTDLENRFLQVESDVADVETIAANKLSSVQAGDNITVDNTDPLNPIISATGGSSGAVWGEITGDIQNQDDLTAEFSDVRNDLELLRNDVNLKLITVNAGTNITIDKTDPLRPIISATGGGGGAVWGEITGEIYEQSDLSGVLSNLAFNIQDKVSTVQSGTGITVDNTDFRNPIVNATPTSWGEIEGTISDQTDLENRFTSIESDLESKLSSVVAGTNITIDNTDPQNPVINATGGGGGATEFIQLTDTPSDYGYNVGSIVRVNQNFDGLEYGEPEYRSRVGAQLDPASSVDLFFSDTNLRIEELYSGTFRVYSGYITVYGGDSLDEFGSLVANGEAGYFNVEIFVGWDPVNEIPVVLMQNSAEKFASTNISGMVTFSASIGPYDAGLDLWRLVVTTGNGSSMYINVNGSLKADY